MRATGSAASPDASNAVMRKKYVTPGVTTKVCGDPTYTHASPNGARSVSAPQLPVKIVIVLLFAPPRVQVTRPAPAGAVHFNQIAQKLLPVPHSVSGTDGSAVSAVVLRIVEY